MKVIVNVDDYGYTKSQIDGVIYGYQNGVISSTTCLANCRDELMEYAAKKAKENPGLGIGCHLVLTLGESLTKGKTICDENGMFAKHNGPDFEKMDRDEIYAEFKAQIERFIKYFGKKPTHLDGHHHTYGIMTVNRINEIVWKLTEEYGLADGRQFSKEVNYIGDLYNCFTIEGFKTALKDAMSLNLHVVEHACHAAFVDEEMFEKSSYNYQRIQELKVLVSPEIKEFYKQMGLERATY